MAMLSYEEAEKRFGFHKAAIEKGDDLPEKHSVLREYFKDTAAYLDHLVPDGRNKTLALTALEEASMWCHKGLAND